jgi:hypothetical protein
VDDIPDVEKADQHSLNLDFDIRAFFGPGNHHKLFLISLTFRLAISSVEHKISHSLSVATYALHSRLDKADDIVT